MFWVMSFVTWWELTRNWILLYFLSFYIVLSFLILFLFFFPPICFQFHLRESNKWLFFFGIFERNIERKGFALAPFEKEKKIGFFCWSSNIWKKEILEVPWMMWNGNILNENCTGIATPAWAWKRNEVFGSKTHMGSINDFANLSRLMIKGSCSLVENSRELMCSLNFLWRMK